ncbi:hypothetical protein [Acutalibacter muris]|nr:hypothetical protein [Acutalibacter muris]
MNTRNNVRYYFLERAMRLLLERGVVSQEEYEQTCRRNAEILHPDPEYIR